MADVRAVAGVAVVGASAHVASIEITHFLWLEWGRIAQKHLAAVRAARTRVLTVREEGGNWAREMEAEHGNSLITISAVAHALDGVYGELKLLVPIPRLGDNASRHYHIRATLHESFRIDNGTGKLWKKEFTWLHDLRDAAVHPQSKSRPSVLHPIEGHGSYEASRYCLENCERAMRLLRDVLGYFLQSQRIKHQAVAKYASQMSGPASELLTEQASIDN